MDFQEIIHKRYAAKLFDGRKIPENKISQLLEMIRYAPSSFNIQPWTVKIIKDDETKEKLAPASWNQGQIKSCSHLLVFCANTDISKNIIELEKLMIKSGAKPRDMDHYMGMMRDFEKNLTEEQKLAWAQRQVYLALGNALNGAKSLGFDSCPMEGFDPKAYSKILELPENLVPTALCPVGYASDSPAPKIRFPNKQIFI